MDVSPPYLTIEKQSLQQRNQDLEKQLTSEQQTVSSLHEKLNSLEETTISQTAESKRIVSEISVLLVRTRAQLEHSEAKRQELHLELAQQRKELTEKQLHEEQISKTITIMEQQFNNELNMRDQREKSLRSALENKEKLLLVSKSEVDLLEKEHQKGTQQTTENQRHLSQLKMDLKEAEQHKEMSNTLIEKLTSELKDCRERVHHLQSERDEFHEKCRNLEDCLETRKVDDQKVKFSQGVLDIQVRDLKSGLNLEQQKNKELQATVGKLKHQLADMESKYDSEREVKQELQRELQKMKNTTSDLESKYLKELDEKHALTVELSGRIEMHELNFEELKSQLTSATSRQATLDETLMNTFDILRQLLPADWMDGNSPTVADVADKIALLMKEYRTQLEKDQAISYQDQEVINTLADRYAELESEMSTKNLALKETQATLHNVTRQLELKEKERNDDAKSIEKLQSDLKVLTAELNKERTSSELLKEELETFVTSEHGSATCLREIYERLNAAADGVLSPSSKSSARSPSLITEPADKMKETIENQLARLLKDNVKIRTERNDLRIEIGRMEEKLQKSRDMYESQVEQVSSNWRQREDNMLSQIDDIGRKYDKELEFLKEESQRKVSSLQTELAATRRKVEHLQEQMELSESIQVGLERDCKQLQQTTEHQQSDKTCLMIGSTLLACCLISQSARVKSLSWQRQVLSKLVTGYEAARDQSEVLVCALSSEADHKLQYKSRKLRAFRYAALAIIAAGRLQRLSKVQHIAFSSSLGRMILSLPSDGTVTLPSWLHTVSHRLMSICKSCFSDTSLLLERIKKSGSSEDELPARLQHSFAKLLFRINEEITPHSETSIGSDIVWFRAMSHRLAEGDSSSSFRSSQQLMSVIHNHLLEFIRRLHAAETDRRSIRKQLLRHEHDLLKTESKTQGV